ncbi:GPW/gp25 family protein [Methylobacterium gregans]|uniref:IraD/Gp25-like domain-containing protein n=1 Tax=Methylobacterium gregans TaxID=374424 RepID=A0AA37MAU9_9HYPH|nr:GPW/gp25 family protein [Methylobacterium gregans]MDQ0521952.1 phage baseplate assembly protein W [Methylobacterium gregans]GJD78014.1 hypothetical protein NBEOAGPD_1226 [Methylobacterium gregans]GLS51983.1 hypothetical protein GCM10007886_01650 [Methylobacterium gregans]
MSVGIDRNTGRVLRGFAHVKQSLGVLFSTGIGSRILLRLFGSAIPSLLGKNIVPSTFLKFATAIHVAVELWEPRFRLIQVTFPRDTSADGSTPATNSPERIRAGRIGVALHGQYRPRGHLGDPTPEGSSQTILF